MDTVSSGCGLREIVLRENPDLRESIWIGTTKIDLKEDLSYIGIFLLNRTSEKCHTQQLQTNHTHSCRTLLSTRGYCRDVRHVRSVRPPPQG